MANLYKGDVCYINGWHYSVVQHPDGAGNGDPGHVYEVPGERLVLDDDGSYRYATDADTLSWHDRKHERFASVDFEDGAPGERVTPEEMAAIREVLNTMRGGQ